MPDAARLEVARRLDWRFLLPDAGLRHVVCGPGLDPDLLAALETQAEFMSALGPASGSRGRAPAPPDLAVLRDPDPAQLAEAASRLGADGTIYVETTGGVKRRKAHRTLRRLGFESVDSYWHLPSFDRASAVVPLAESRAVRHLLRRPRGRRAGRFGARVASALNGTPLLGLAAGDVSLVARKTRGASAVAAVAPGLETGVPFVLLTPRFRASRHVISLLFANGSSGPTQVAKRPRIPQDTEAIAREARLLGAAERIDPGGAGTIPHLVQLTAENRDPALVETAMIGDPITRGVIRSDRDAHVALVVDWLSQLPRSDPDEDPDWFERLLERPLRRLAACLPADAEEAELVGRTLELCRPLRAGGFPLVLEHGDLAHPNLLRLEDGRLGVLDWELGHERGLPLHDLCFFLGYAATASLGKGPAWAAQAVEEAFFGPDAWALPAVSAYSDRLGIPARLRVPLFVACWARVACRHLRAMDEDRATDMTDEAQGWLRGNRYTAVWRTAVQRVEGLELDARTDGRPPVAVTAGRRG